MSMWFYNLSRKRPARVKAAMIDMVQQALGPDYDVATHFTPSYNPWDQRLCHVSISCGRQRALLPDSQGGAPRWSRA